MDIIPTEVGNVCDVSYDLCSFSFQWLKVLEPSFSQLSNAVLPHWCEEETNTWASTVAAFPGLGTFLKSLLSDPLTMFAFSFLLSFDRKFTHFHVLVVWEIPNHGLPNLQIRFLQDFGNSHSSVAFRILTGFKLITEPLVLDTRASYFIRTHNRIKSTDGFKLAWKMC